MQQVIWQACLTSLVVCAVHPHGHANSRTHALDDRRYTCFVQSIAQTLRDQHKSGTEVHTAMCGGAVWRLLCHYAHVRPDIVQASRWLGRPDSSLCCRLWLMEKASSVSWLGAVTGSRTRPALSVSWTEPFRWNLGTKTRRLVGRTAYTTAASTCGSLHTRNHRFLGSSL